MKKILITLNDQGGAVMNWNYLELAATLRAEMASHPPIVVIADESKMFDRKCIKDIEFDKK